MKVESREYKLLIDHRPFVAPGAAVTGVWSEIADAARIAPFAVGEARTEEEPRAVCFYDTPDHTLRQNGLVLRRRVGSEAEYTLKCRSEDRYFAAGTDVAPDPQFNGKAKLEEDIAPPFVCRFSHSSTVAGGPNQDPFRKPFSELRDAAALFPVLGALRVNGRDCDPRTPLQVVNALEVRERVWKGEIEIRTSEQKSKTASVALILWARAERPAVAELSFRLKDKDEDYSRKLALAARATYVAWQRLDCARIAGMTKTEYVYRDASRD